MIFVAILVVMDAYLSRILLYPLLENHSALFGVSIVLLQIIFLSLLWMFFYFFKSEADTSLKFEEQIRDTAFVGMGVVSFLFVFSLARDVAALISWMANGPSFYTEDASIFILALSTFAVILGAFNARYRISTPRVKITVQNLPQALSNLKIVQLSDVHLGTGPKPEQIAKLVDRALSLNPDLIALTGDIIDGNITEMAAELKELGRLKAKHGVYFVLGNHEVYWKHLEAVDAMKALGFTVLLNQGVEVKIENETVFIGGINDPALAHMTRKKEDAPQIPVPPSHSKLNIALVHQPQFAQRISEFPSYHLQLSGHTHGGQFFPWNLAVKKMYQFHAGLGRLKNLWVYVNTGSGYWGPPIRLGTNCEVTLLTVHNT